MEINRAAFGALAVFGIVAAGGGAYLANRHNDAAMQPVALLCQSPRSSAVTETENTIMTPPAATVEAAPLVAAEPAPAPSRRANVARRAPAPARTTPPASQRARTSSTTAAGNASAPSPTSTPSTCECRFAGLGCRRAAGKHDCRANSRGARAAAQDLRRAGDSCRFGHRPPGRDRRHARSARRSKIRSARG